MAPHDPLNPHSHDPNLTPPEGDGSFELILPNGCSQIITVEDLRGLKKTAVSDCYIVSTGHGTSGPFTFSGVTLQNFIAIFWGNELSQIEIISVDGFGNRVLVEEMNIENQRPIILAYEIDRERLSRQNGLVRLIVPSETDDALRQVKWIGKIKIV